jgi:hypothetical protein
MLSNVEREKLVLDLYYNQHKNVRQIAQEARMSFRNIGAIVKKKEAVVNGSSACGNGIAHSHSNEKPHKLTNSLTKEISPYRRLYS